MARDSTRASRGGFVIDQPRLNINRKQARQEIEDKTPIKDRGWQQAVEEIYPLKINHFAIYNGEITYIDQGPFRPLELTAVNLFAENIRNVSSAKGSLPFPSVPKPRYFNAASCK